VLEEAKRAKARQNGTHATVETRAEATAPPEPSLNEIMERLNSRIAEGGASADES
jgi:DNA-directed RNA polymerase subunit K/omega